MFDSHCPAASRGDLLVEGGAVRVVLNEVGANPAPAAMADGLASLTATANEVLTLEAPELSSFLANTCRLMHEYKKYKIELKKSNLAPH
jgi:hypothetical protein